MRDMDENSENSKSASGWLGFGGFVFLAVGLLSAVYTWSEMSDFETFARIQSTMGSLTVAALGLLALGLTSAISALHR